MDFVAQVSMSAVDRMRELWGGRLPTWEEYKLAYREGRVRANKSVAAEVLFLNPVPKSYMIMYGIVTLWGGFLLSPAAIVAWFFFNLSAWWILGAILLGWFLVKVSREGHCEGMKAGAANDKEFYDALISKGAFMFEPKAGL